MERYKFFRKSKDLERSETNNKTAAFDVLFSLNNKNKMRQANISKHNLKCGNQVILFLITDGENSITLM